MIVSYIDKSIQDELEKRRKALARESNSPLEKGTGGTKQFNKYLSRTPYVVMASNLDPVMFNVAIGGGVIFQPDRYMNTDDHHSHHWKADLVNHMHGFKNDGTGAYRNTKSKGISPIPGIKDISVEFKGGYKGIREATVNWAVSNLEDLEFYTPHFLAIGRSVALEWGWTMFDTTPTQKFISSGPAEYKTGDASSMTGARSSDHDAIIINPQLFKNPFNIIKAADGNLDGIGGVITNFDFKLREDGGFDCKTILSAMGVDFFNSDGLDSSGENGIGLILSDKNKFTYLANDDIDTQAAKLAAAVEANKDVTSDGSIIEELLNLPVKLDDQLESLGPARRKKIVNSTKYYKEGKKNWMLGAFIVEKERLAAQNLNFFRYQHRVTDKNNYQSDYMIRWGWLEDNVFSKYTAAIGHGKTLFNFRSIDDKGESIKISYHEKLIPINPFRSMIFANSTGTSAITGLDGGDFDFGDNDGQGRKDTYFSAFEDYFDNFLVAGGNQNFKFNHESGYGKMRNIYVSLSDVMESFGFNDEYVKTLIKSSYGAEGYSNEFEFRSLQKVSGTFYANSDKITPPKTMESAINRLLKKINRNFHNFWEFKIVSDTETMDNIRIIDENYVAPNSKKGPTQIIDYTTADTPGIYKFPSFTVGSTVKSQTLEFKLPDAMKTVAMYGTNAPTSSMPADPLIKKFRALGAINKNPFIKLPTGKSVSDNLLDDLQPISKTEDGNKYGNTAADSGSLIINGNAYGGENEYKYIKLIEKTTNKLTSAQSATSALKGDENNRSHPNLVRGKDFYYIVDALAHNVLLKAEAIKIIRSAIGKGSNANESYLIPAELGLEIDGIGGIMPGNICHTAYIQRIYNEKVAANLGPNTFFQIFNITQKVSDDGWTTSLETKMRINGTSFTGTLDFPESTFVNILEKSFGTPVDKRQKAANTAKVQSAVNVDTVVVEEAAEENVSLTELSGTDSTPDAETAGSVYGEGTKENLSLDQEFTLERKESVVPVTTAVTGNVKYEGLASQNNILYKARPDLRSPHPDGGWIVATKDVRKKAWEELHKRDESESTAAIVADAAQVETQTVVTEKSKEIKEQIVVVPIVSGLPVDAAAAEASLPSIEGELSKSSDIFARMDINIKWGVKSADIDGPGTSTVVFETASGGRVSLAGVSTQRFPWVTGTKF